MTEQQTRALDYVAFSKTVAHALRHQPWLYELELDDEGWVPVEDLLEILRSRRVAWRNLSEQDLATMIARSDKQRYELRGGRIRALYGHSVPGRLAKQAAMPPAVLYHGTHPGVLEAILAEGLKPMRRQYVHLSTDVATARLVARRRTSRPVILSVEAARACEQGITFYRGNDQVWLADVVPPAFIRLA
jgi:putative RNA 2'-phosphotransferase